MKAALVVLGLFASTTSFAQAPAADACAQKIISTGMNEIIKSMSANEIASSSFTLNFAGGPNSSGDWQVIVDIKSVIDGSSKTKSLDIGVKPNTCALTPHLPVY